MFHSRDQSAYVLPLLRLVSSLMRILELSDYCEEVLVKKYWSRAELCKPCSGGGLDFP